MIKSKETKVEKAINHVAFVECFQYSDIDTSILIKLNSGSAVVIGEGKLLTNLHVINQADEIKVTYNTFETHDAFISEVDEDIDIALLRTNNKTVKSIGIGDSEKIKVGTKIYTIGHPLELRNTVTSGVVSYKDRYSKYLLNNFIQTDAAVNPGSSGGALINTKGELIGIVTSFVSGNGGFTGYSFSVPVNSVKKFIYED